MVGYLIYIKTYSLYFDFKIGIVHFMASPEREPSPSRRRAVNAFDRVRNHYSNIKTSFDFTRYPEDKCDLVMKGVINDALDYLVESPNSHLAKIGTITRQIREKMMMRIKYTDNIGPIAIENGVNPEEMNPGVPFIAYDHPPYLEHTLYMPNDFYDTVIHQPVDALSHLAYTFSQLAAAEGGTHVLYPSAVDEWAFAVSAEVYREALEDDPEFTSTDATMTLDRYREGVSSLDRHYRFPAWDGWRKNYDTTR
jgi:hypothetical protein